MAAGVVVPIPMRPVFKTVKMFVVVAIVNSAFEEGMVVVPIRSAWDAFVRFKILVPVAFPKYKLVEET